MGSTVFYVERCLPVLLDASFATTTANAETVISHLISLDVAGMMSPLHSFIRHLVGGKGLDRRTQGEAATEIVLHVRWEPSSESVGPC